MSRIDIRKQKINDAQQYIFILFITLIINNFTGQYIKLIYYTTLLFIFYRSKKDFLWLAVFFSVIMSIGSFYADTKYFFELGPVKISLLPLFSIAAVLKYVKNRIRMENLFKKPFKIYFIYLVFLIIYGFLVKGNSGHGIEGTNYYAHTLMFLLAFPLFITIPKILNRYDDILRFTNLLTIAVFINIFGQFITIIMNKTFLELVGIGETFIDDRFGQYIVRAASGAHINFIVLIVGLYFFLKKEKYFKNHYLVLVVCISFISVIFSVTRGWIIAFGIVLISTVFITGNIKYIRTLFIIMVINALAYIAFPVIKAQTDKVIRRMETIELILEGDLTGGGTVSRLTTRHEKVMRLFYDSPIIGSGFSQEAMDNMDQHVGNQNILMSGGVIGYSIILYFWIYFIHSVLNTRNQIIRHNKTEAKAIMVFIPALLGLLTIHSSSTFLFAYVNYVQGSNNLFFMAIIFAFFNTILIEVKKCSNNNINHIYAQKS